MHINRRSVYLTLAGAVAVILTAIALGTNLSDYLSQHVPDGLVLLGVAMAAGALSAGLGPSVAALFHNARVAQEVSRHEAP